MRSSSSLFNRFQTAGVPLLAARLVLGGMFIYMGMNKIADPVSFLKQIHLYNILPESPGILLNSVAIVLPWLEVVAGAALLWGLFVRGASLTILLMLLVFTPAILLRALAIQNADGVPFSEIAFDCGCGGGAVVIWKKLLENGGLILLSFVALISRSRFLCLEKLISGRRTTQGSLCSCGCSLSGDTSGTCPECGIATDASPVSSVSSSAKELA